MAAPEGNQFWKLRSKHGRNKLFESANLLWEAACEYFQWCEDNPFKEQLIFHSQGLITKDSAEKMRPFTIEGLCHYLCCNKGYFHDFEKGLKDKTDQKSKDFSDMVTRMRETIYRQKFEGSASGFFNPLIIARDLGLKDRSDITTDDEKLDKPHISLILNGKNVKLK